METSPFNLSANAMSPSTEAQLRATGIALLSSWLGIFATSLITTRRNSRWRFVRFRGFLPGSQKKRTLARLMTLRSTSAVTECGENYLRRFQPSCPVIVEIRLKVPMKWRTMLHRLLLKAIKERYGIDFDLCWKTTPSTPIALPISEMPIKSQASSPLAACSAPSPRVYTIYTSTGDSTE